MKLLKNCMIVVLCFLTCSMSFTGCRKSSNDNSSSSITTPVITLDGGVVTWQAVDGADKYELYINGAKSETLKSQRYSLENLSPGTYEIYIAAISSDGTAVGSQSNKVSYTKQDQSLTATKASITATLADASYSYNGTFGTVCNTVIDRQLLDKQLWANFVDQFRSNTDGATLGWRGEFWGKMMIGACEIYEQTGDQELYSVLQTTVKDMLTTQSKDGRISTYGRLSEGDKTEFYGWDMWCRKYVIEGMEYFYGICTDDSLKQKLVASMNAQMDYILKYVGKDKIEILDTASQWSGLPSASILEAINKLYIITNDQKYLDFAQYLAESGGCKSGNQVEQAVANTTLPYQWGAPKAYELTSYFHGLLGYYNITGDSKYKTAVVNYAYDLLKSEITVTGGMGCKVEEFNYGAREQANPSYTGAMLETCATVTMLRFFYDVYLLTGDTVFVDSIERTLYNQLIGAFDTDDVYDHAFTSYSALVFGIKPSAAAGGCSMPGTEYGAYGCCQAFSATGVGTIHYLQYQKNDDGILVNLYLDGQVGAKTPSGKDLSFTTETNYPYNGAIKIKINQSADEKYTIGLRIPSWSTNTTVSVNSKEQSGVTPGGYFTLSRNWKDGDEIVINMDMHVTLQYGSADCSDSDAQYNAAVLRGPIALARDARLDNGKIFETVNFKTNSNGEVELVPSHTAGFKTMCEFEATLTDGSKIHLVDYGSVGKTFSDESVFSVFLPTTNYWKAKANIDSGVALVCSENNTLFSKLDSGLFGQRGLYYDYKGLSDHLFKFVDRGNDYYSIEFLKSAKTITVNASDGRLTESDYTGDDTQLFSLTRIGLYSLKIISKYNDKLVSVDSQNDADYLYSEADSGKQKWKIIGVSGE